jgi:hypothetical protein
VRLTTSPRKETALFRNLIEAETGLIFWRDMGEGKDGCHRLEDTCTQKGDWKMVVGEAKFLQGPWQEKFAYLGKEGAEKNIWSKMCSRILVEQNK